MRFLNLYLTLLLLVSIVTVRGQNYAVQSSVQIMPPYSVYLSDYATEGNGKLQVILRQGDLSRPVYQLRLVMTVELNGRVIMRTSRFFNPAPIVLDPGVPTVISGAELAPYVDSRNIDFIGYSKDQYEKTKALPEGSYQIIFTAYDYRRQDQQVSNAGSGFYYLAKNEPPLVNFPACGSKIALKTPQQIVFSWLPRNTSSPTSAQETEYEFELYETRPVGRNPNDIVLTTQPVFRLRTDYTQIIYGPAEPMLLDGMVYVWRVRAIDRSGKDAFRNNGYAEVCTFTYGGTDPNFDLGVVRGLQAIGETDQRAKIWWEEGYFDGYRVYYKKSGAQWEWFYNEVTKTEFKVFDLEPDNEYEVRVQGKKDGFYSPFTEIIKFRTREKVLAQCGDPAIVATDLGNPLPLALTGMTINASDHDVTFIQVESIGQPGWFKGNGTATLPFLGGTYFVYFDRLYVDENREAKGGKIRVASEGMAKMIEEQLAAQKDKKKAEQQKANQQQWSGTDFYEDVIEFNYAIEDIVIDASGNLLITQEGGQAIVNTEVPAILAKAPDKAVIVEDKNGDQYVVQKDKTIGQIKVTKVEGGGLQAGNSSNTISASKKEAKLITEILQRFSKQIAAVITPIREPTFPRGAGPMAERYDAIPIASCMPEAQEQLKIIKAYTDKTTANESKLNAFIKEVFKNESDKVAIQEIINTVTIKDSQKFEDVLTAEQLQNLEGKLCPYVVSSAKQYFLDEWWRAPYWERAAKILKEQFEDQDLYDEVSIVYGENECKTIAILKLSEEASITTEVTFSSRQTSAELYAILHDTYKVDFLVSRDVTLEGFGEWFWNYMAIKDDRLHHGTSFEAKSVVFIADMLMAAPGTVQGWITGRHWRTDEELAMWEHVLGILDVIPSEAFAKAGITALVIKIGSKVIDISKFSQPVKSFITTAYKSGLKLVIKSKDEIIVYAGASMKQIGRLVNGVLIDLYWNRGGDRILAKLANVKYLDDDTKRVVEGSLEVVENAKEIGVRIAKESSRLFKNIEDFKAAIARGDNVFYVGKHSDITPRPNGINGIAESHHGVNSVWMKEKYIDYVADAAPSVYMLKTPNHNATRAEFNRWAAEMRVKQALSKVDYAKVTIEEMLELANRQFNVADVPQSVRDEYFKLWNEYIQTLIIK